MLSVQSLQTLRGAAAAQLLQLQPRRGSSIASLLLRYAFSRAQAGARLAARAEQPQLLAWPARSVQAHRLIASARSSARGRR